MPYGHGRRKRVKFIIYILLYILLYYYLLIRSLINIERILFRPMRKIPIVCACLTQISVNDEYCVILWTFLKNFHSLFVRSPFILTLVVLKSMAWQWVIYNSMFCIRGTCKLIIKKTFFIDSSFVCLWSFMWCSSFFPPTNLLKLSCG